MYVVSGGGDFSCNAVVFCIFFFFAGGAERRTGIRNGGFLTVVCSIGLRRQGGRAMRLFFFTNSLYRMAGTMIMKFIACDAW